MNNFTKYSIENRKNQMISVIVDIVADSKGLAFVMHGLGGFKEQDHIMTFAQAFHDKGLSVVLFDTTNTLGESDGLYEDATVTNYYEDLEDVIGWASEQDWYQEPFWLAGHSLGGICTALYAENHPEKVKAVAPISPVVSGDLSLEAARKYETKDLEEWGRTGWLIRESNSKKGVTKKLKWSHMVDRLKYNLLDDVEFLTMPVLLVVGENDTSTPAEHVKMLFDAIEHEQKEYHVIKNAPHTFRESSQLAEIKEIFYAWIEKIL